MKDSFALLLGLGTGVAFSLLSNSLQPLQPGDEVLVKLADGELLGFIHEVLESTTGTKVRVLSRCGNIVVTVDASEVTRILEASEQVTPG